MFELRGATKRYGDLTAVHPMDLVIEDGETTVIIGPSGCGKSTTLELLIGLEEPDDGQVLFDGEPLGGIQMLEL
ncbi:MAG: ATP-binding cassette domain-containing protein, partial [Bradymonadaceae bacterium]